MEENYHFLTILIEQDLHVRIKAIKDGNFPNENDMINEVIQSFEKSYLIYMNIL